MKSESFRREKLLEELTSNFLDNFQRQEENHRKEFSHKKPGPNKSTLSLHITAYENSIENTSDNNLMNSIENSGIKKSKEEKELIKKCKKAKLSFCDSAVKAEVELPRQQEGDKKDNPEVMQFKASQKLFNPNQPTPTEKSKARNQKADDALAVCTNDFLLAFEDVIIDPALTMRTFQEKLAEWCNGLTDVSLDWEIKVLFLKKLRGCLKMSEFQQILLKNQNVWHDCLTFGLKEQRSGLTRQYAYTTAFFAVTLQSKFMKTVEKLFDNLLELVGSANKVKASFGTILCEFLATEVIHKRFVPLLFNNQTNKSKLVRKSLTEMADIMLRRWPLDILVLYVKSFKQMMNYGLNDHDSSCRCAARSLYVQFESKFPQEAQQFFEALPKAQKSEVTKFRNKLRPTSLGSNGVAKKSDTSQAQDQPSSFPSAKVTSEAKSSIIDAHHIVEAAKQITREGTLEPIKEATTTTAPESKEILSKGAASSSSKDSEYLLQNVKTPRDIFSNPSCTMVPLKHKPSPGPNLLRAHNDGYFEEDVIEPQSSMNFDNVAGNKTGSQSGHYIQANDCPGKAVQLLAEQGDFDKITAYCQNANYAPDYVGILRNVISSHSPKTAEFAYALASQTPPLVDPEKIVDCFEEFSEVENCMKFLFHYLTQDTSENGRLQTRAIEMNLNHAPTVAEAILSRRIFNHYDKPYIAQLCEKAQLYTHALELYDNVSDIKRVLTLINKFDNDKIVEFCGKLSAEDCYECVEELVKHGDPERVQLACLIATKYSDFLGPEKIIKLFEHHRQNGALFFYLQSIVNHSTDPEVHFKYIQAAVRHNQIKDAERVCRESSYYDPSQVIAFLKEANLQTHIPLIIVCDKHDRIKELIEFLYREKAMNSVEVLATQVNPKRLPAIVSALFDLDCPDDQVKKLISSMRRDFEIDELVDACISRNRLSLLQGWLEQRLLDVLEKLIITGGSYREHRNLQTLMVVTAIREAPTRVMGYVNVLDNYDAPAIADLAVSHGLFEEAFEIYRKFGVNDRAVTVLIENLKDYKRAYDFAERVNKSEVWSALGLAQLRSDQVAEGVDSLIRAGTDSAVHEVVKKCTKRELYDVLVRYLQMARKTSKETVIDTELCFAYAKTNKLRDIDDLLSSPNRVDIETVGDGCYKHKMYDAAKIVFSYANNFSKSALTLVKLGEWQGAVDAARKANSVKTWKAVCFACVEKKEFHLAMVCGLQIVVHAEEIEELLEFYQSRGYFEELIQLLEAAILSERTHAAIFTELAILYTKHKPEKLHDHLDMFWTRMNIREVLNACEAAQLWADLVFLYDKSEGYENARSAGEDAMGNGNKLAIGTPKGKLVNGKSYADAANSPLGQLKSTVYSPMTAMDRKLNEQEKQQRQYKQYYENQEKLRRMHEHHE